MSDSRKIFKSSSKIQNRQVSLLLNGFEIETRVAHQTHDTVQSNTMELYNGNK